LYLKLVLASKYLKLHTQLFADKVGLTYSLTSTRLRYLLKVLAC
jgi:hypothetical protein